MKSDCVIGYKGPLCQTCDIVNGIQFAKYDAKKCEPCFSKEKNTVLIAGSVLAFILLNLFLLKLQYKYFFFLTLIRLNLNSFFEQKSANDSFSRLSSIHVKMIMNYIQFIQLFVNIDGNWSSRFYETINIQSTVAGTTFYAISLECMIQGIFV